MDSLLSKSKTNKSRLHDNTIEAYIKMHSNNALMIPAFTVNKIFSGDYSSVFENFYEIDYVCGLRHINDNHWTCFFVNLHDNSFIYIDPKGNIDEVVTSALNHWRYT